MAYYPHLLHLARLHARARMMLLYFMKEKKKRVWKKERCSMDSVTISPFRAKWFRTVGAQIHRKALAEGAILCHIGSKSVFRRRDERTGEWTSECLSDALKAEIRENREALAFYAGERRAELAAMSEVVPPGLGSSDPKSTFIADGEVARGN